MKFKSFSVFIVCLLLAVMLLGSCGKTDQPQMLGRPGESSSVRPDESRSTEHTKETPTAPKSTEVPPVPKSSEEPGPEDVLISEPYMRVSMYKLYEAGLLSLGRDMKDVTLQPDEETGGVYVTGPVSQLTSGQVNIDALFEFDKNPVGRISIAGLTEEGTEARAKVFVDGAEEPLAVLSLDHPTEVDGWSAGRDHTQNVYGQIENGTHRTAIGFETEADPEEEITILLKLVEFSEDPGIPVIYFHIDESRGTIDEMNQSPDHSAECYGEVDILVPEGYEGEYTSDVESLEGLALDYIRGRGNSTWKAKDKKPYKVKLDKSKDLFGMGKNKHWLLIANRYDNSLVRNRMTYWLGAELGLEYTPQCVPVDVVMNDEYYGSYLLMEQLRIDSSRIDIDELTEEDVEDPEVTGGYLLALSPYWDEDERSVFETLRQMELMNDSPDFAGEPEDGDFHGNEAQKAYIRNYVQKTEDAIFGEGFKDAEGISYQEYLDLETAAYYWWIQEFTRNGDAYGTDSSRMYKKRDGKLYWGPWWDFDYVAWGNQDPIDDFRIEDFNFTTNIWFDRLLEDPAFTQKLRECWDVLDEKFTEITREGGLLSRYYEELMISERYDFEKLGYSSGRIIGKDDETPVFKTASTLTYEEEVDKLRSWISQRKAWINEHIDEVSHQIMTVTFVADGETLAEMKVKKGTRLSRQPEAPVKEGYYFLGWDTEDEELVPIINLDINENMVLYAHYIDEESASKAQDLYLRFASVWADVSNELYEMLYKTAPEDAMIQTVVWSSSDEDIAGVDEEGRIVLKKTGTVTITGTLKSGNTSSYELKIYDSTETTVKRCEEILLSEEELTLHVGESRQNRVVYLPDEPLMMTGYYCESDNWSVASVNALGVVTGISAGTANITVSDYLTGVSVSYPVTVLPESGMVQAKDAAYEAADIIRRLNALVDPWAYDEYVYDAYARTYHTVVDRLENEAMVPVLIDDLKTQYFKALKKLKDIDEKQMMEE